LSNVNAKLIILKIKKLLKRDPNFFKFILKIIPIDLICETKVKIIKEFVKEHHNSFISETESFKIVLKRRKHEKIERTSFIEYIASSIENNVDLENPDKIIRIEILGNITGISFLKRDEIIKF